MNPRFKDFPRAHRKTKRANDEPERERNSGAKSEATGPPDESASSNRNGPRLDSDRRHSSSSGSTHDNSLFDSVRNEYCFGQWFSGKPK